MSDISLGVRADEIGVEAIARIQFFGDKPKEVLARELKIQVPKNVGSPEILDVLYPIISDASVISYSTRGSSLQGTYKGEKCVVEMWTGENTRYNFEYDVEEDYESSKEIILYIFGNRVVIREVYDLLDKHFSRQRLAKINWWTRTERGVGQRALYLPPLKTKLHPEFYPDITNPTEYLKAYLKSDASVLLLAGAPGTGKTTLLRHLICENKLSAHVVYDENLMNDDKIFQGFLFGEGDIMVIEDADVLITSRERDANHLMARFLNVSDGLIKLPSKKLVFTTNISDFNKVDPALVRAGRCFGVIHTRPLNLTEAQAAAKVANLPIPVEKGEYTLADLFNDGPQHKARTIGFVA